MPIINLSPRISRVVFLLPAIALLHMGCASQTAASPDPTSTRISSSKEVAGQSATRAFVPADKFDLTHCSSYAPSLI